MAKRTANIKVDLSTPQKLVDAKKKQAERLQFEIAYLEMRKATGTENKVTLQQLVDRNAEYEKSLKNKDKTA